MYLPCVWIYHCVLLNQTETNSKFCVAVAVFKFTRKKTVVLLDALVSFRTFIYLDRAIRMSHNKTVPVLG